jgi:NAD(P)-dependent dehydrogenase (short-subunit alcohol dehydrogenase family)
MQNLFISGVSSGLGHGLARLALQNGHAVSGLSRREPSDIISLPRFRFAACDLATADTIPEALDKVLDGVGKLDLVVLNAGVLWRIADMADTPLDVLKWMVDVNVWANKPILDFLFRREIAVSQVVAISSGASVVGARGWNGYSISKAALNMLIKLYAAERPETHFTSLAPGLVETYMQDQVKDLPEDDRFPSIRRLQKARGTLDMPKPDAAAEKLFGVFPKLLGYPSGGFVDVRTMDKG